MICLIKEFSIYYIILFLACTSLHMVDLHMEELETFTCGEALGRYHGKREHYAPDDWRDAAMWNECVFSHRRKWPEGYKEKFTEQNKQLQDKIILKAIIKRLEDKIKEKNKNEA